MGNLDPQFYGGEPIWNTAERQGVRTASFYWVGSEVPLESGQPSIWKPFDKSVPFSDRADSVISWLKLPEDVRPHLIMWYMEEPDAIGHSATPDSSATLDVVENLDKVLNHFSRKPVSWIILIRSILCSFGSWNGHLLSREICELE